MISLSSSVLEPKDSCAEFQMLLADLKDETLHILVNTISCGQVWILSLNHSLVLIGPHISLTVCLSLEEETSSLCLPWW